MHLEGFEDRMYPLIFYPLSSNDTSICELRAIDASKLNTMNLSKRCVQLGAIRLNLKMHAMVARKLLANCVVWTQPNRDIV